MVDKGNKDGYLEEIEAALWWVKELWNLYIDSDTNKHPIDFHGIFTPII